MSANTRQSGAELEVPEGRITVTVSPEARFSHLHFDRRLRAWRSHPDVAVEANARHEEHGAPELSRA